MQPEVIKSEQFTLNLRDVFRGLVIASLTSALVVIQNSVVSGAIVFNWSQIGTAAIAGGVGYLLKNWLLEPAKVITVVPQGEAEQTAQEIKKVV